MAKTNDVSKLIRVGAVVAVSLLTAMTFLFFIGSEQKLFSRKYSYNVSLENVSGLAEGNPVQLTGVTVGSVTDIRLPSDPKEKKVDITISIEKKFSARIRQDSRVRIKKLGLIAADSYIEVSPGSPNLPAIPPGGIILAQKGANVDQLIASGGDVVENVVELTYSLKKILARIDRGEGLIGELTSSPKGQQRLTDAFLGTLDRAEGVLKQIESGQGVAGKFIYDEPYANELSTSLSASVKSLQIITRNVQSGFESGQGAIPALLNDPEGKRRVYEVVDNLRITSENLSTFSDGLKTGEGLVPRLVNDREYAEQMLGEFRVFVKRLTEVARKLNEGEGTAGRLISDPSMYEAVNDILIGVNESKLLRWFIRNRQQSGIEKRYETEKPAPPSKSSPAKPTQEEAAPPKVEPPPPPATDTSAPPAATNTNPADNAPHSNS